MISTAFSSARLFPVRGVIYDRDAHRATIDALWRSGEPDARLCAGVHLFFTMAQCRPGRAHGFLSREFLTIMGAFQCETIEVAAVAAIGCYLFGGFSGMVAVLRGWVWAT